MKQDSKLYKEHHMLEAIEIRRQIERGWPHQHEAMSDKGVADAIYGAITAGERAVEKFLKDKLGEREISVYHRGRELTDDETE